MLTKDEHIIYWLDSALSDWESVTLLFNGGKYVQSLFFTHLTLEKISKAIFVKFSNEIYPPKTHDIVKLLSSTNISFEDEIIIFLKAFNVYNLEGRYPDYLGNIYRTITKEKTSELIKRAGEIRKCLLEMMQ
jgi:HEPN domain-containing protein